MDKFDVQGTNVTACDQSDGCQVIIDSGTSLLGMIFRDFQEKNMVFDLRQVGRVLSLHNFEKS